MKSSREERVRVGVLEALGLKPLGRGLRQCVAALGGKNPVPPSRVGLSSTRIFKPRLSLPTWLGRDAGQGRAPIYNLFNRRLGPPGTRHSVRVTSCRDYRGRQLTYDGHIGTDFAIPIGTPIVSAAAGRVLITRMEMARGGLKVLVDHGGGVLTCSCHFARVVVSPGDVVERGQLLGYSGASGLELVLFFPWVAPHLHLTVLHDTRPVDPFAAPGEQAFWRAGNQPVPFEGGDEEGVPAPSRWSTTGVDAAIAACSHAPLRSTLEAYPTLEVRGAEVAWARLFMPQLFTSFPSLFEAVSPRRAMLDLPFPPDTYRGAVLPDEGR